MEISEFDVFKRLEKVEEKTAGKFKASDAFYVATAGLYMAFFATILHAPERARQWKDMIIEALQKAGLDSSWIDIIRETLNNICSEVERIYDEKP